MGTFVDRLVYFSFTSKDWTSKIFFLSPSELRCFLRHTSCYLFTNWQLPPPLVLSKLTGRLPPSSPPSTQPPFLKPSKWNQWKVSMSPPTLTSFLRPFETFRHWHHFYDGAGGRTMDLVRSSPPSISSRTVRDQKVKCPPHQNIPLREQIEGKNVRDVKWTSTVWFLNCILLWFSKRYC